MYTENYGRPINVTHDSVSALTLLQTFLVFITARCYALERGYATVSRPSVRLSVCPSVRDV